MKSEDTSRPTAEVSQAVQRRHYIVLHILRGEIVHLKTLAEKFPPANRTCIHNDVDVINQMVGKIAKLSQDEGGHLTIVPDGESLRRPIDARLQSEMEKKEAIGRLATSIVWGPGPLSLAKSRLNRCCVREKLLDQLRKCADMPGALLEQHRLKAGKIATTLEAYWTKPHRVVALDAGSTSALTGRELAQLHLPDSDAGLSSLTILTNNIAAVHHFRERARSHSLTDGYFSPLDLILLGGRLRVDTDAIAGELSRQCLQRWSIHADISLVGASSIDLKNRVLEAGAENEASIKQSLLNGSSLRFILADSSKFSANALRSSFPFAVLGHDSIDAVICDSQIEKSTRDLLAKQGIVTLTASL